MDIDPKLYQELLNTFDIELTEQHQLMVDGLIALEKVKQKDLDAALGTLFRISHNLKGASKSISNEKIASIAHELEDLFTSWREEKHIATKKEIDDCLIESDNMLKAHKEFVHSFKKKEENEHLNLTAEEGLKIPASRIERANSKANDFVNFKMRIENLNKIIASTSKELSEYNQEHKSNTLKTLTKQLNSLKDSGVQLLGQYSRSLQGLQDILQSMRLVPITHVLIPLSRTVREISQSLKKTVQLKVEGGDIQIDKGILDLIKDPLNHLVRNAIDHGMETDTERKELKKPIPSTIHIKVIQKSGEIVIEFKDDGKGIDIQKLKAEAFRVGKLTREKVNVMTDEEALELIYHSGITTQKKVSEYSGRGVGLDAVKEHIKRMKGQIKVLSTINKGTTFRLTLPLTLSTTRGLMIKQGQHPLMLPTLSINRLYTIVINQLIEVDNQYAYLIKDVPVPVKSLAGLIDMETVCYDRNKKYPAILIDDGKDNMLVITDEITNEHDCVVYPLPKPLNKLKQYIGVTTTGQNELILVLDPSKLLDSSINKGELSFEKIKQTTKKETMPTYTNKRVLIVDDSLTARTTTINSLNAVGFKTQTAVNGEQAWDIIQQEPLDCIVTDISMPKMDGFQLTQHIKSNTQYAKLPVIMVTSLDSEKDKQHGLKLGASAYLVKKQFDTSALIELIRTLL